MLARLPPSLAFKVRENSYWAELDCDWRRKRRESSRSSSVSICRKAIRKSLTYFSKPICTSQIKLYAMEEDQTGIDRRRLFSSFSFLWISHHRLRLLLASFLTSISNRIRRQRSLVVAKLRINQQAPLLLLLELLLQTRHCCCCCSRLTWDKTTSMLASTNEI